jgi:hypothetical protein
MAMRGGGEYGDDYAKVKSTIAISTAIVSSRFMVCFLFVGVSDD